MARRPFGFAAAAYERDHWWRSQPFKLSLGGGITAVLWWWRGGATGLLAWLTKQRSDRAGRLRHWMDREVWFPARGRRASCT